MHTIYLIGQITANPATYKWREDVSDIEKKED
jgi:hypothetical protein